MPRPNISPKGNSRGNVCFRLDPELQALMAMAVESTGMSMSEIMRTALRQFFAATGPSMIDVNRRAYDLCKTMISRVHDNLPATFEEAVAEGLLEP